MSQKKINYSPLTEFLALFSVYKYFKNKWCSLSSSSDVFICFSGALKEFIFHNCFLANIAKHNCSTIFGSYMIDDFFFLNIHLLNANLC